MVNEFKKLSEVNVLEELSENAHLIVEDGEKIKRYPATSLRNTTTSATIFTKDYDPENDEYFCSCNKTFLECLEDYNNCNFNVFVKGALSSGYHALLCCDYEGYDDVIGNLVYRFWDPGYGASAIVTFCEDGTIYIEDDSNGGE